MLLASMKNLVITTIIWAFSFSLIGVYLSGSVDPYFSVLIRIVLAVVVFLPFLLCKRVPLNEALRLMGIGAVQLGLMYLCYYQSFEFLTVPEVLIFTIFTPIYVTLIYDLQRRKFSGRYLLTASLAVLGTAVIRWGAISSSFLVGCLAVQGSNLCFAYGQVAYKRLADKGYHFDHYSFGYFYLGALVVALIAWLFLGNGNIHVQPVQWMVLLWLGIVASGGGYFLWNQGARQVNSGALAIMNNALVPAGLLVNLLIWNHDVHLLRLTLGAAIIVLSLFINQHWARKKTSSSISGT